MPQVSVLTETRQAELWVPIPHMFGVSHSKIDTIDKTKHSRRPLHQGFTVRLDEESLQVKMLRTVPGTVGPREIDFVLT
jgi:hypothetical protein